MSTPGVRQDRPGLAQGGPAHPGPVRPPDLDHHQRDHPAAAGPRPGRRPPAALGTPPQARAAHPRPRPPGFRPPGRSGRHPGQSAETLQSRARPPQRAAGSAPTACPDRNGVRWNTGHSYTNSGMSAHPRGRAITNNDATRLGLAGVDGSGWNGKLRCRRLCVAPRANAARHGLAGLEAAALNVYLNHRWPLCYNERGGEGRYEFVARLGRYSRSLWYSLAGSPITSPCVPCGSSHWRSWWLGLCLSPGTA